MLTLHPAQPREMLSRRGLAVIQNKRIAAEPAHRRAPQRAAGGRQEHSACRGRGRALDQRGHAACSASSGLEAGLNNTSGGRAATAGDGGPAGGRRHPPTYRVRPPPISNLQPLCDACPDQRRQVPQREGAPGCAAEGHPGRWQPGAMRRCRGRRSAALPRQSPTVGLHRRRRQRGAARPARAPMQHLSPALVCTWQPPVVSQVSVCRPAGPQADHLSSSRQQRRRQWRCTPCSWGRRAAPCGALHWRCGWLCDQQPHQGRLHVGLHGWWVVITSAEQEGREETAGKERWAARGA